MRHQPTSRCLQSNEGEVVRDPVRQELMLLQVIGEQLAVPRDQLCRFAPAFDGTSEELLSVLRQTGCVEVRRFLVREEPWIWLSERGVEVLGLEFPYKKPHLKMLRHHRAINEARLFLQTEYPDGVWICERTLRKQIFWKSSHVPDGVLELDGYRYAIEVERSPKSESETLEILLQHFGNYAGVVYFCNSKTWGLLHRLQMRYGWRQLVVLFVPESGSRGSST